MEQTDLATNSAEQQQLEAAAVCLADAEAGSLNSRGDLTRAAGLMAQRLLQQAEGAGARWSKEAVTVAVRRACHKVLVAKQLTARFEMFYSKSKDTDDLEIGIPHWRKLLSNFSRVPDPASAAIVCTGGRNYPTVEHAFQAGKFLLAASPEEAAQRRAADFEVGGTLASDAAKAKAAGARKGMAAAGCTLDQAKWGALADRVMEEALASRWAIDPDFRRVLLACKRDGVRLVHFERSAAKSYWGGALKAGASGEAAVVVGTNRLGQMLEALRDSAAAAAPADDGPGVACAHRHKRSRVEDSNCAPGIGKGVRGVPLLVFSNQDAFLSL